MRIAILGPGSIGSTFAFHLAKAGHEVTVIARGQRLEQLTRDGAIVKATGERAQVQVAASLDATIEFDLVLVTVLGHQVDPLLPALKESRARKVMFMFNTFEPLARLREVVGAERFAFGFPAIIATMEDGKLTSNIVTVGQITTVTDSQLAEVFTRAGIKSVVHHDMESWLRTHAAFIIPFMIGVRTAYERKAGLTWRESWRLAEGMEEAFALVRKLGNSITPAPMVLASWLPRVLSASVLWLVLRIPKLRKNGAAGMREPIALIGSMEALGEVPKLRALAPHPGPLPAPQRAGG